MLLGVFFLAACVTAPPAGPFARDRWEVRKTALQTLENWRLAGRIAVRKGDDGWQADLNWSHESQRYAIDLVGPLGQGRVSVRGDGLGVSLRTADGETYTATDPEQLLEQAVGLRIPINGLIYWIRGLPDPQRDSALKGDEQGRLTRLEQSGWVIDYTRYTRFSNMDLPTRLQASQDDFKVKLAIRQWQVNVAQPTLASEW